MKKLSQKGFTLIELLIVIAVLGALAAVVVPAVTSFLTTSDIAAANVEVANVKTATMSYLADRGDFPTDSDFLSPVYLSDTPKAKYAFDDNGQVSGVTEVNGGWDFDIMKFITDNQTWVRK